MIAAMLRIDARRPASWIALAAAAAVAVGFPVGGAAARALACGGLLAVAAVGDLLVRPPRGELPVVRVLARSVWPLAGLLGGGLVAGSTGAVTLVGGLAAAVGCLAAWSIVASAPGRIRWQAAFGLQGDGRGEPWADRLAMGSMLAAMAVCYFLAPERAAWYAAVAAAWFMLLAVPRATLWGDDAAARSRLIASAAGRPRPPGTAAHAARSLAASGCLLGWPAVVALALNRDPGWTGIGPIAALALLVALVAVAAGVAAIGEWRRLPADTPLAVTAALLAATVARTAQVP